ncbi:Uncharacterised protein [Mycobacteroides abscessus subsp. abscessus]|nr:Uncharacterised protein [Mycobacteroides abscessus subsp. abscessus]
MLEIVGAGHDDAFLSGAQLQSHHVVLHLFAHADADVKACAHDVAKQVVQ